VGAGDLTSKDNPFSPVEDATFRELASNYESYDKHEMIYTPEGRLPVRLRLYFRWFPSDTKLEGRYLVVMAMSEASILNSVSAWVPVMSIALIIITAVLNFAMVEIICTRRKEACDVCSNPEDEGEAEESGEKDA
jgi:hypothetical protein